MLKNTRNIGTIGEEIACKFLVKNGFRVVVRNYQKKWGEIDIIAEKDRTVHFFEVKSVSRAYNLVDVAYRPEENVHEWKTHHIRRMIQTYFLETGCGPETGFKFHVLSVYMNQKTRYARVKWIENLILC